MTEAAAVAGFGSASQSYPGELVIVTGGQKARGGFIVQCISAEDTTLTVAQGVDYRPRKGRRGEFADAAFAALQAARD